MLLVISWLNNLKGLCGVQLLTWNHPLHDIYHFGVDDAVFFWVSGLVAGRTERWNNDESRVVWKEKGWGECEVGGGGL